MVLPQKDKKILLKKVNKVIILRLSDKVLKVNFEKKKL